MLSLCCGFLNFENCLSITGARTKTDGGARTSPHPVYAFRPQAFQKWPYNCSISFDFKIKDISKNPKF